MPSFIRRFTSDPGTQILLNIESVNILDLTPPASIQGVGSNVALIVGEFDDGPFNTPYQVQSATDLQTTFGGLGYTRNGTPCQDPCATTRSADGAITPEYWNGNALVQLNGKTFGGLQVCRVNTSVGAVTFTRCASVTGSGATSYALTSGQILALDLGSGQVSATFTAAAATVTAVGGTYPTTFSGGQTLVLGADTFPNVTVTFLAGDQLNSDVVSRINLAMGFTFATLNAGQLKFTSRQLGTGSAIRIVSGSTGVLTQLGLTAATTSGTGNVANIAAVTPAEVKIVVQAAVTGSYVDQTTAGLLRVANTATPATGTITIGTNTTAAGLGFIVGASGTAATGVATTIPAGTRVQDSGATKIYVTMQTTAVTASSAGPYTIPVRPATDDGTGVAANAGTITVISSVTPIDGAYSVTNPAAISAALSETAIDAAYVTAFNSTLNPNSVAAVANFIWSARQSNLIRQTGRLNALAASANGLLGRKFIARTPLGTTEALAVSSAGCGVGVTRDQRVYYCWPQVNTTVPAIAQIGTAGGAAFTATGAVDIGADGLLASIMTQLPPEENPGQLTSYGDGMNGLETSVNAQNLQMSDYITLKAAGIVAPRVDGGALIFQSGVTSVNPLLYPTLVNINRRNMADFIEDSLAIGAKPYAKKTQTLARRRALAGEIKAFLEGLLAKDAPNSSVQRIAGFSIDVTSGNTAELLAAGMYRILVRVQTLPTFNSIVLACTIGEGVVTVQETNQQLAA